MAIVAVARAAATLNSSSNSSSNYKCRTDSSNVSYGRSHNSSRNSRYLGSRCCLALYFRVFCGSRGLKKGIGDPNRVLWSSRLKQCIGGPNNKSSIAVFWCLVATACGGAKKRRRGPKQGFVVLAGSKKASEAQTTGPALQRFGALSHAVFGQNLRLVAFIVRTEYTR